MVISLGIGAIGAFSKVATLCFNHPVSKRNTCLLVIWRRSVTITRSWDYLIPCATNLRLSGTCSGKQRWRIRSALGPGPHWNDIAKRTDADKPVWSRVILPASVGIPRILDTLLLAETCLAGRP